jgi:glycosyltransferase involved in cell wall biosynthesis
VSNRIWIDLTDLLSWRGHFTGIQRVVYMIAKEYSIDPTKCFFYYDERSKLFRQIDFSLLEDQFFKPAPVYQPADNSSSKKQQVKLFIKRYMPGSFLRSIPSGIKLKGIALAKKVLHLSRYIKKSVSEVIIKSSDHQEGIDSVYFKTDDTVCILGAGWHKDGMISALTQQKIESDFKLVHIIYDLIPVYFPQLFGPGLYEHYTRYLFDAITISDHLVAISESTKRDTQHFCKETGLHEPPIDVIRLGEDFEVLQKAERPNGFDSSEQYILCVGTIEIRKNHQLLYQAYRQAHLEKIKNLPKIVVVGRSGWLVQDLLYLIKNDPVVKSDFIFLESVSDAELKWLYQHCLFTIYPSVYEGWGLPIAESLAYGKLCLTSNISSMTEIAGNLIDYFSPYNPLECLELIKCYCFDEDLLNLKEQAIKQQYKQTTWHDAFVQFKGYMRQVEKRDFLQSCSSKANGEAPAAKISIELPTTCSAESFRQQYDINVPFLLHICEVDSSKGYREFFSHFIKLRNQGSGLKKLVLLGEPKVPAPKHSDIVSLGFVSEQTKWDALAACDLFVMPSLPWYEDPSLLLLKAWAVGKPVLVDGDCEILVKQCRRAQGGLWYRNESEFALALEKMDKKVKHQLGSQGKKFVEANYICSKTENQYLEMIEDTIHNLPRA